MKAYVKSYKEILKNGIKIGRYIYTKNDKQGEGIAFVVNMKKFCGKGPFEFIEYENKEYFRSMNCSSWDWHISWLAPFPKDGQYLLEF